MKDIERDALQWLTLEELAARRRHLVREYDRALRRRDPDQARVAEISAEADAIAQVQRDRRWAEQARQRRGISGGFGPTPRLDRSTIHAVSSSSS